MLLTTIIVPLAYLLGAGPMTLLFNVMVTPPLLRFPFIAPVLTIRRPLRGPRKKLVTTTGSRALARGRAQCAMCPTPTQSR